MEKTNSSNSKQSKTAKLEIGNSENEYWRDACAVGVGRNCGLQLLARQSDTGCTKKVGDLCLR